MKKKPIFSLGSKLTLLIVLMAVTLGLSVMYVGYSAYKDATGKNVTLSGRNLAKTAANFINGDKLAYYLQTGEMDYEYYETLRALKKIKKDNDVAYMYVVKPDNRGFTFVYDTDETDNRCELGHHESWDTAFLETSSSFLAGEEIPPILSNERYGWLLSIYEPIYGSDNKVKGYVGADFSMDLVNRDRREYLIELSLVTAAITILFALGSLALFRGMIIAPINKMATAAGGYLGQREASTEKSDRSWFADLGIRTRDEIGSLASSLAEMEENINEQVFSLDEATKKAEASSRAKNDFLAKMSHEIRTPMNAIVGMSELILREEASHAVKDYAVNIKQASTNLVAIINDILDFSKIESGKLEINLADYAFPSMVSDVVNIVRMRLMEKPISFLVNIDSNIPHHLIGDEVRIRQIILNLLNNACKYCSEGFVSLSIKSEMLGGNRVLLSIAVADSGIGIKGKDLEKLFDDFTQVDTHTNRGVEGTGLGLAITKKLCEAMGGRIVVKSVYGEGSTFTVSIPQRFTSDEKVASVQEREKKSVILYENREYYAQSVMASLSNLGVACYPLKSQDRFCEQLQKEENPFVFVPSFLLENVEKWLEACKVSAKVVVLAEYSEQQLTQKYRVLYLPVHSIAIANVLNDLSDSEYNEGLGNSEHFIAPEARVLIVDDIATNLKVAEGLMLPYEMKIDVCASGQDAIEHVHKNRYDVIFMDHMMPEMDGIEATGHIRNLGDESYYKNVPIVALTANAVFGTREMFLRNGFNDFLAKPIEVAKLNHILENWIPREKRKRRVADGLEGITLNLKIVGLNTASGITMTGGSIGQYMDTLSVFYADAKEKIGQISETCEKKDFRLYTIYVHALKAALAAIGSADLSEMAKALEYAGKAEDYSFVSAKTEDFLTQLKELLVHISEALSRHGGKWEMLKEIDNDELKSQLEKLKSAIDQLEMSQCEEILSDLQASAVSEEVREKIKAVAQDVLLCEYDSATRLIDELIRDTF